MRKTVVHKFHKFQQIVHSTPARYKVIVAGRRWGKCTAEGSLVSMADGSEKAIETILPGELVLTVNEDTYAIEPRPVQHVHDNGVRETLLVTTRSGKTIRATPNHPVLANNVWTELKDVKVGDLLATPTETVFGNERLSDHEIDFLAIWLAEGGFSGYTNQTPLIIETMTSACSKMGVEFSDAGYDRTTGLDWRWRGTTHGKNGCIDLLRKYGLRDTNAKTKYIPDAIFKAPKEQVARFLNLFVATDGSINQRAKNTWAMEIGLANEKMLRQLAALFAKFGIHGQISKKVHKAKSKRSGENFVSWRFIVSSRDSLLRFCNEIGALGKETQVEKARLAALSSNGSCNEYLPISYDEFVKHLVYTPVEKGKYGGYNCKVARDLPDALREGLNSWRKQTPSRISRRRYEALRGFTDGYFDPLADEGIIWDEVVSIDAPGEVQTYDLTVCDNHNYVCGGIVTHNTAYSRIELITKAASKPKQLVWYIAPTYSMAFDIMWSSLKEAIPRTFIRSMNETKMTIVLKNGSIIQCKGADKPDSLRGRGVDLVVLDEYQDFKSGTWEEAIFPTLTDRGGSAIIIGTPKAYNHLYELYKKGQSTAKEDSDWASWQFPTATSPFIPKKELDAARRNLDERSFKQEFEASFETMSGRVYYAFDRNVHVGDYPFDPKNYIIVGQDFNVDPMSSVILQYKKETGELWAVDEILLRQSNTVETVEEIERRYLRLFPKNVVLFPDPAGGNRSSARGESDLQIFRDKGLTRIHYHRKHPPVADRINAVNTMLRAADGTIRLKIDRRCKNLIESLEQVIYKAGSREIDKSQDNEHITDALGYPVEYLFPVRRIPILGVSR